MRMPSMLRPVGFAVLTFLGVAQSEVLAQYGGRFQRIATELRQDGFSRVTAPKSGWLDDDESTRFSVWLSAGKRYVIFGTCDSDCRDVDLGLYSPNGASIGEDLLPDNEPIVEVVPYRSGMHEVHVSMANCSREPCEYTVGIFER
jgi:hypothetical protein